MENNVSNETSQLNCLIKKHKQLQERSVFKSFYQSILIDSKDALIENNDIYNNLNNYNYQDKSDMCTMSKVYVNPNYKNKNNVIHINPRVQVKSSIYINPKLIKNIPSSQSQEQSSIIMVHNNQSVIQTNVQDKCSVYINPKLMTRLIFNSSEQNNMVQYKSNISNFLNLQNTSAISTELITENKSNFLPSKCAEQNSIPAIYRMKKSKVNFYPVCDTKLCENYTIQSKTKLVNNCYSIRKSSNSNLIALSQRKLVRVRKSPKLSTPANISKSLILSKRKLSSSGLRKVKCDQKNILSYISQLSKVNNMKFIKNVNKNKLNWYNSKADKSVLKPSKKKITKIQNNSLGLISIGGIMYKTSRNQLIRSNSSVSPLKTKCNLLSNKYCQYYITKNGKQLFKKDLSKKKINTSLIKVNASISSMKNYKTNASNKAKQRSLQILRNKMRKNNQPCLLYQRFGYCANQIAQTCHKVHDKKQVSLCKNFLQGKCLLENCQLSHNIGPEKMPTCKYFLEGCCTRDKCPYLHVKVSSKNPICVEFLRGYCSQGNECKKRHIYACPEFDKNGKCSKGKFCQYPHKSHLTETERFNITLRCKNNKTSNKQLEKSSGELEIVEYRKRYYDETSEELKQKKENELYVRIIKAVDTNNKSTNGISTKNDDKIIINKDFMNCEQTSETLNSRSRPPIGPLPAYIPIN